MKRRCKVHGNGLVYFALHVIILIHAAQAGFLFPDLGMQAVHRSGSGKGYSVAALEVDPYLRPDGSGYLPDLMKAIASKYSRIKNGTIAFHYEIVPAKNWEELNERARSEHVQVAFGFVSPYLLRHDVRYRDVHASMGIVRTSLKLISKGSRDFKDDEMHESSTKRTNLISVLESPMDRLLVRHHLKHNTVYEVNSFDIGLEDLNHHDGSYLITDATVADTLVTARWDINLQSVCPSKRWFHGGHPTYAFFGRNSMMLKFLNDLLKVLDDEHVLQNLNSRYFGNILQC